MTNAASGEGVTITLRPLRHAGANFKTGQEMKINAFGKKKYNIIIKAELKTGGEVITLHPLSKIKLIRKVQVFFIRLYLKLKSK